MLRSIASDTKFIPHGVLHYYSTGQTCEEAVANLLRSHEKMPELFPRVHAQEVEFWYNSFKEGNFDLHQDPTVAPHSKLENLPVLHHVLHQVGAEDQKSLHRTCKQFKNMIENEKRLFDLVEFRMSKNSVMLQIQSGITSKKIRTVYVKKEEGGCTITKGKISTESEKEFMGAALHDFSKTVEMIHTKIRKMIIKYSQHRTQKEDRVAFMTAVCNKLNSLKEKLHVERLVTCACDPLELESILKAVKPKILVNLELDLHNVDELEERDTVFKITEMEKFQLHFPHLKDLSIFGKPVDIKLNDILHISEVCIEITGLSPNDVNEHKENLLRLPGFKYHKIDEMMLNDRLPIADWIRAMEPFDQLRPFERDTVESDEDEYDASGQFPFKDGSGDMLTFKIDHGIMFERKTQRKRKIGGEIRS
ncbi:hypothetical protein CAEBREN_22800 [Caenorhabditis brenneri]|uniref:DUF38 domain-containing protein n=1 Tax=Caenorhabditis brenneri TaxID=135651 RepID=G0NEN7_CAEBE|nr:hypothetical protein CAEBREN_22800 [Caenorhabditis brenneri]